ncbi:MAG: helix-turn-helix domain-containing protein [Azonexus sp.]|jgi:AraC family transcriptional regulator of adaptative response / DNA-3-methyladenine glycosylase II|nr:helix-turn-helix domain-containing protein [Azonexus sp.]
MNFSTSAAALDADACYRAMQAHDARFDGSFFTGVTSTHVYCRPVCRVKLPRRENCRFFRHAAEAEAAGFRPCLRCRPELAPRAVSWSATDASFILARQAAQLIDEADAWPGDNPGAVGMVAAIAARLGVSDRHLRRIFAAWFGVSPLQYWQTRRLLTAKQLLADTRLSITEVALASGFTSARRFSAAFLARYGLHPNALRQTGGGRQEGSEIRLGFRPPYDIAAMLDFFARRSLRGVETVTDEGFARTLRLTDGKAVRQGWFRLGFVAERQQARLSVSDSLATALPIVISRVRALFDLDADPLAINAVLHASFPHGDGLRVPGAVDGFELAVRAVLGQQITVAAARTLGSRLVGAFGEPLATPLAGLDRLFPTPAAIASAGGEALGQLGITRQRHAALLALAREMRDQRLPLHPGVDVAATMAALKRLPGIGEWTAQYIALRALRWPDAFPAGDIALQKALGVTTARAASEASLAWRPWRGYATLRAWQAPRPERPT